MTTIAIIDKYPMMRMGLELFLKNNYQEAVFLESESLDMFAQNEPDRSPDLFILGYAHDLKVDNYKLIDGLRKKYLKAKIIVYDGNPEFLKVASYFQRGVTGYISKSSDGLELLRCISQVENGKNYIGSEVMEVLLPKWLPTNRVRTLTGKRLTSNEYEIARSLADGDRITSIADHRNRKVSTISTIKKNIFKKLNIDHIKDLVHALNNVSENQNRL